MKKLFFFAFVVKHWQRESFSWPLHTPGQSFILLHIMLLRFSVNFKNFILNIFYFYLLAMKLYYCGKLSRKQIS